MGISQNKGYLLGDYIGVLPYQFVLKPADLASNTSDVFQHQRYGHPSSHNPKKETLRIGSCHFKIPFLTGA